MSDETTKNGTITKGDLLSINAALIALDNPRPTMVDGKQNIQPYSLGEKARYAIIRNLKKMKAQVDDINAARDALQVTYNPRKLETKDLPDDVARKWEQEHAKLLAEPLDEPVKFHHVKLSEFQIAKNSTLPASIIAVLVGAVIDDDAPQDADTKEPTKE